MDANRGPALRILLVEDNEAILKGLSRLLGYMGHSVSEAASVPDALSLFEDRPVDLLISDINLGSGSGLDLIRSIRQSSEIPAIAISGQPDMAEPSLAGGFAAFLHKPVTRSCLQEAIRLVVPEDSRPAHDSHSLSSPHLRG